MKGNTHGFKLASERALDTMNLCAIRSRPSAGVLNPSDICTALNGDAFTLNRPYVDGHFEDLTQDDLDVLRAIITFYVDEAGYGYARKHDFQRLKLSSMPDTISFEEACELAAEEKATGVLVTAKEIRSILQRNNKALKTDEITKSLFKLSKFTVDGSYIIRNSWEKGKKTDTIRINGTLLTFGMGKKEKQDIWYSVIFATKWGQYFLHNIKAGNLIWVKEDGYKNLTLGAKNILRTIMVQKGQQFYRRDTQSMLKVFNIKVGKNPSDAMRRLQKYYEELARLGFIKPTMEITHITRNIDPSKGTFIDAPSHRQDLSVESQPVEIPASPPALNHNESESSKWNERIRHDEILDQITETIKTLGIPKGNEQFRAEIKQRQILRKFDRCSVYYLWSIPWFHQFLATEASQHTDRQTYDRIVKSFEQIGSDVELQNFIQECVQKIEAEYNIPANIPT
ncbi:hypothetical protein [Alicyclobacillus acidoterrestris]|uniref:Uncharacterized protein n=1 Tax=Alicyclobacillus acidoterrestris (strain ATCC 49025 / DSM 3922 / CIP 106132 / NCIMB 13137 / GD3B) TaxID=1356854 RepID=T0CV56_ALIAG|nr:hypothetical protein [Alicyclobacillus acidoterrestris]EPZ41411.1 hypothetical protein N007_17160 [Alicyclobacillus acidoterrestris ATCC 49025]UNO48957.1 hypothetical protein K1I37_20645 [Alicyclobacillus acidoterrestris]